jgi:4'-phosphopantetheinyl transferase
MGPHGKPALDGTSTPVDLRFNLAHSGRLALYAVALQVEVGIDVERVRAGVDFLGIAARFFSLREAAGLCRLSPELRTPAFVALWTRKEAAVKATGEGLSDRLATPAASDAPDAPPTAALTLFDLNPGPATRPRWPWQHGAAGSGSGTGDRVIDCRP